MRRFLENLFAVAALVGAEAWFLHGYFSGTPEFEPALAFVTALGVLLGKDPIRSVLKGPAVEHDRELYARFLSDFPSNGRSARFLESHDIGTPFRSDVLTELDRFSESWAGAEHEFISSPLELQRRKLLRRLGDFRKELSLSVFAANTQGFLTMDLRDFEDRPEMLAKRERLNQLATDVFAEHQELIRIGRRMLHRDP